MTAKATPHVLQILPQETMTHLVDRKLELMNTRLFSQCDPIVSMHIKKAQSRHRAVTFTTKMLMKARTR